MIEIMDRKIFNKESVVVSSGFFILSFFWILLSDRLLLFFIKDPVRITNFQSYKGWFYVAMATVYVFYLVNRKIRQKDKLIYLLNKQTQWQNILLSNIPNINVILFDKDSGVILMQGGELLSQAKEKDEKSLDKILTFENENQLISYSAIKADILNGNTVNLKFQDKKSSFLIKGRPILNDNEQIIAGLLVYINTMEHAKVLDQLEEEKEKYATLFNEYHTVNLELKRSYEELISKNFSLKESKERYQNFFMQSTDAIYRIDFDRPLDLRFSLEEQKQYILENGFLAECNPVYATIYGQDSFEHLRNTKISDLLNIQTIQTYFILFENLVRNNYKIKNIETNEPLTDGKDRFFLNTMIGIIDDSKLVRIWGTKTSITQLKQYEKELIAAKKRAEESDHLKSAFLANMSHEIRTPLNGIIGFAELLCLDNLETAQRQKYVQVVRTSNNQLLQIIDDILDISKIETHQLTISLSVFSLNQLMKEINEYLTTELKDRRKTIATKCHISFNDNDDLIESDKERLFQVITNLLNNSVKFTRKGLIEFGYRQLNESNLEFFVSDTGIGIPNEMHDKIFMRFKQVEDYFTRTFGGTGLGLAISKGIVELLGGKIKVKSELGEGAVFKFTIPFKKAI